MGTRADSGAKTLLASVDSLAAAAAVAPTVRELPVRPAHLRRGRAMIIVVDENAVAARTIERPPGRTAGPAQTADALARELAAMSAILAELPESAGAPGAFTEDELAVLREAGVDPSAVTPGVSQDPVARSIAAFARLIAESLSVEDTAKRLGVQPSRIRQRLGGQPPTLYGFKLGGSWRVPRIQFRGRATLPGLEPVVAALPRDLHPLEVFGWFTRPQADLETETDAAPLSPRDWLLGGRSPEAVTTLARELEHDD
jgi:hypothetical protein